MTGIQKVAKHAGVSTATVSRVLNHADNVSDATRLKVEAAIEQLSYVPNALARNFRTCVSHNILVIISELSNLYYAEIIKGINEVSNMHGYNVLIYETNSLSEKQTEFLSAVKKHLADGAIVLDTTMEQGSLSQLGKFYPVVQCSEYCDDISIPHVAVDNRKGGYLATQYLIEKGHRRIAFIGTGENYRYSRDRREGFLSALHETDINLSDCIMINCGLDFESGKNAAEQLMQLEQPPTAFFFVSDMQAVGAINYFNSAGISVPSDVAVIGFDNIEICKLVLPQLTTVAQPMAKMGRRSAEILLQLIKNPQPDEYLNVVFQPEIVIRDSV